MTPAPARWASDAAAVDAHALVQQLQQRFRDHLEALSGEAFVRIEWLRDGGRHGGGARFVAVETAKFNRAAINVSQVHYDDEPDKRLGSATAISTIIHPHNPAAPSVHIHISWTGMRDGSGGWRVMADLNPAIAFDVDTRRFQDALRAAAPDDYASAAAQGDRYFFIPALKRHRGVTHFYLEQYATLDRVADRTLARRMGEAAIDTYAAILQGALSRPFDDDARAVQRAYHTLYLFQVLTLDRGTTSGLLVHDQNDVGIMGSLPAFIDRQLLSSWAGLVAAPQELLVKHLVDAIPADGHITEQVRAVLAGVVRAHFRAHPEALQLQARGDVIPLTAANHGR